MVVSAILRVVALPFRLAGGAVSGTSIGLTQRVAAPIIKDLPGVALSTEYTLARSGLAKFVGGGMNDILVRSGLSTALKSATPYRNAFNVICNSMGGRGLALLGIYAAGAAAGLAIGLPLLLESYDKINRIKNRLPLIEPCQKIWVHGGLLASGLALGVGGILMLTPPFAALGMTLAIGGAITTVGLKTYKWLTTGVHMFRYPQLAPWPLSSIIRTFSNSEFSTRN